MDFGIWTMAHASRHRDGRTALCVLLVVACSRAHAHARTRARAHAHAHAQHQTGVLHRVRVLGAWGRGACVAAPMGIPDNYRDGAQTIPQGHALKLAEWASAMGVAGVINLAPDEVSSLPDVLPPHLRHLYVDVRHSDGKPLTDKPGDGSRLLEVLPTILDVMEAAAAHGRVFVHCAQGRSRSGSIAAAHLIQAHSSWSLYDALAFLAARRPEIELLPDYALALEQWAVALGRPPSIERVADALPRQLRGPLRRAV